MNIQKALFHGKEVINWPLCFPKWTSIRSRSGSKKQRLQSIYRIQYMESIQDQYQEGFAACAIDIRRSSDLKFTKTASKEAGVLNRNVGIISKPDSACHYTRRLAFSY